MSLISVKLLQDEYGRRNGARPLRQRCANAVSSAALTRRNDSADAVHSQGPSSVMPDPERAPIVRRLFKQYATGMYTNQEVLQKATQWGLTNRRGQPPSSQAIGMLLRNRLYVGMIDVPDSGIRDQRGDFDP
jgi:Recombinase